MSHYFDNNLTDKHLIDRVLHGDARAFGLIVKNTEGLVARIVFKMAGNPEDRKDLAQDIYLKAYANLVHFKYQSKLSTWIARIAYNTCLSFLEKRQLVLPGDLYEAAEPGEEGPGCPGAGLVIPRYQEAESLLFRKELSGILQSEIEGLSPVFRTLITLYHHEELSYEEIGEITALPAGTIKSYLFRARKKLKDNLLTKFKKEEL